MADSASAAAFRTGMNGNVPVGNRADHAVMFRHRHHPEVSVTHAARRIPDRILWCNDFHVAAHDLFELLHVQSSMPDASLLLPGPGTPRRNFCPCAVCFRQAYGNRLLSARDLLARAPAAQRPSFAFPHHLFDLFRCFPAVAGHVVSF